MTQRLPEQSLNDTLRAGLAGLDPVRVENPVGIGTPDINYINGWIESKALRAWPVRATTIVKIDHYTTQQRGWQMRRRAAGGRVHVALQVADDFMLFDAAEAAQHLGLDWTKRDCLMQAALALSPWDAKAFRKYLAMLDSERAGGLAFSSPLRYTANL